MKLEVKGHVLCRLHRLPLFLAASLLLCAGCGEPYDELGEVGYGEYAFKHGPPSGPAPWNYYLTCYGGPSDSCYMGTPACGGKKVDGKDNDCDGQVDEGGTCPKPPPPPKPDAGVPKPPPPPPPKPAPAPDAGPASPKPGSKPDRGLSPDSLLAGDSAGQRWDGAGMLPPMAVDWRSGTLEGTCAWAGDPGQGGRCHWPGLMALLIMLRRRQRIGAP